jgi:hypothetical protein
MTDTAWQNRIVGYGNEAPDQLLANPRNARIHPKHQQDALQGILDEVGWVQNVIVNKSSGAVVDGHLRIQLAMRHNEASIPVTYVELTDQEEAKIIATLDPLAALASYDKEKLDELLREVDTGSAAVQEMLSELAQRVGVLPPDWEDAFAGLPDSDRAPFQQMTFTVSDEQAQNVKAAIVKAKDAGPFVNTGNENSNGNALARICEAYVG